MTIISIFVRLSRENCVFEAKLNYIGRAGLHNGLCHTKKRKREDLSNCVTMS